MRRTKELLKDLQEKADPVSQLTLNVEAAEGVNSYKYCRNTTDIKLTFHNNTQNIFGKKWHQ